MKRTLTLRAAQAGRRLDVALAELTGKSRSFWQGEIKAGRVSIAGQPAKPSYLAEGGEPVKVESAPETVSRPAPLPEVKVLYRDDDVIVIDKPAGLVAHAVKPGGPSVAGIFESEVEDSDAERPGIVHRLDKDTSGVMILARHPAAKSHLQAQFARREAAKTYLVLVRGTPKNPEAVISLPVGRSKARPTSRSVIAGGKEAITRYKVVERLPGYSLIEAKPETGRTHQIRVHFRHIGHPVAGDIAYGDRKRPAGLGRQFLHAASLSILLPSGSRKTFTSPLPPDLESFLERLKERV